MRELGELRDVLDRLLLGEGTIVSITGEPGIGKSRLVAEMTKDFDGRIRFLAGQAVAYAETIHTGRARATPKLARCRPVGRGDANPHRAPRRARPEPRR